MRAMMAIIIATLLTGCASQQPQVAEADNPCDNPQQLTLLELSPCLQAALKDNPNI